MRTDMVPERHNKARLLCSNRLSLFIVLGLSTCVFVLQSIIIDFVSNEEEVELLPSFEALSVPNCYQACRQGRKKDNIARNESHNFLLIEISWSEDLKAGLSVFYYGALLFSQLPAIWLLQRFGAHRVFWGGLVFSSILSFLNAPLAHLGHGGLHIVSKMIQGAAQGIALPALNVLASYWCVDSERSLLMGIAYGGFGIALTILYPATNLICYNLGCRWITYFWGGVGLVISFVAYFVLHEWPETHPRITSTELQFIQRGRPLDCEELRHKRTKLGVSNPTPILTLIITNCCCFWCSVTTYVYLPLYIRDVFAVDYTTLGLLPILPHAGMLAFHVLVAVMFDWLRRRETCQVTTLRKIFNTTGMFGAALSMTAVGFLPCDSLSYVIGTVALFGLCQAFLEFSYMGGCLLSIFDIAPAYVDRLSLPCNFIGLLTGIAVPTITPILTPSGTQDEWHQVLCISAVVSFFGGLLFLSFGTADVQAWAIIKDSEIDVDGSGDCRASLAETDKKECDQIRYCDGAQEGQ